MELVDSVILDRHITSAPHPRPPSFAARPCLWPWTQGSTLILPALPLSSICTEMLHSAAFCRLGHLFQVSSCHYTHRHAHTHTHTCQRIITSVSQLVCVLAHSGYNMSVGGAGVLSLPYKLVTLWWASPSSCWLLLSTNTPAAQPLGCVCVCLCLRVLFFLSDCCLWLASTCTDVCARVCVCANACVYLCFIIPAMLKTLITAPQLCLIIHLQMLYSPISSHRK